MPHFVIDYAREIERDYPVSDLIQRVFEGAVASELFAEADIKLRAIAYEHYRVGQSDKRFVHVTAKILSGRSLEQRQSLSSTVLARLKALDLEGTAVTVEVVEMEKASYSKLII